MTKAESKLPDPVADLLAQERLPAPFLRIHDEDFGSLWLVQSPRGRAWAEDPEQAGPPIQLVQWLGVFPPVAGALLEVQSFDADISSGELELAEWLFGEGREGSADDAGMTRVDPRMRALLIFQEAQLMGARTSHARTPKYNPLRSLKLQVSGATRERYRRLRDGFSDVWGDARRQLASVLDPVGRGKEAYAVTPIRVVVEKDLVQLRCVLGQDEVVFSLGAAGPHLHPIALVPPAQPAG
jgi:hypothetical protein